MQLSRLTVFPQSLGNSHAQGTPVHKLGGRFGSDIAKVTSESVEPSGPTNHGLLLGVDSRIAAVPHRVTTS
jgi:hypothetical protein